MTKHNFFNVIFGLGVLLILINNNGFSQNLSWELITDGAGVSDHQELICFDFKAGSGLTTFVFGSDGASAKQWTTGGLDIHDYFEVSFASTALDTFVLNTLSYGERRSGTSIRNYEIRYSTESDFSTYTSLGEVTVPDNDLERDTTINNLEILIMPQDTMYLRWYGYNAETSTYTWRINDNSLKMSLVSYVPDHTAPVLSDALVVDARNIQMRFNEPLDTASFNATNFRINNQVQPIYVNKSMAQQGFITLEFANDLPFEEVVNLYYNGIADSKGNVMSTELSVTLYYYQAQAFYLLIDEVLSDPSPQVYLPEVEYIELYNTKAFPVQLKDWKLKINSTEYTFPEVEIAANDYLLIIPEHTDSLFDTALPKIELFSDGKLTNSEGTLVLRDPNAVWVHQVDYTEDWHTESYKNEGGWSFEMIDKSAPCNMQNNWASSLSNTGGTPGHVNSINGDLDEAFQLEILNAYFSDSSNIVIEFNQFLSPEYVPDAQKFSIDNQAAVVVDYAMGDKQMALQFNHVFETNVIYNLKITDDIQTCSGLGFDLPLEMKIGIPVLVDSNDIVINEIFFNPKGSHEEYIEFINISENILDLQEMKLGVLDDEGYTYKSNLYNYSKLVFPGDYFVLTKDRDDVLEAFYVKTKERLFECQEIPSISTSSDRLILVNKGDKKIDEVFYSAEFHNPILSDNEGVALERINPAMQALDANGWQSASQASGFGTPTDINSQFTKLDEEQTSVFSLESASFSPDMDGYEDYLKINYQLEKSGYSANVSIYDTKGHKIIDLVENELTGKQGHWTWDGRNQNDASSALGIYILIFELIHADGEIINEKMVCTLAGKL